MSSSAVLLKSLGRKWWHSTLMPLLISSQERINSSSYDCAWSSLEQAQLERTSPSGLLVRCTMRGGWPRPSTLWRWCCLKANWLWLRESLKDWLSLLSSLLLFMGASGTRLHWPLCSFEWCADAWTSPNLSKPNRCRCRIFCPFSSSVVLLRTPCRSGIFRWSSRVTCEEGHGR